MKPNIRLLLFIAVAIAAGYLLRGCMSPHGGHAPASAPEGAGEADFWTCSMHPQIKADKPGLCPLCAMDLIPVFSGDEVQLGPRQLRLSETALALADVESAAVEQRTLVRELRLPGRLVYDERGQREITSLAAGRVERLLVDFTGAPVSTGEAIAEIYSPEVLAASEELLAAARVGGGATAASRRKLELLGVPATQIDNAVKEGRALRSFRLESPADGVLARLDVRAGAWIERGQPIGQVARLDPIWAELDAFEADLAGVATGQTAALAVEAFPGDMIEAQVVFVPPALNDATRSVKLRADVANPDGRLRPGMYLRAQLRIEDSEPSLAIPDTAPLLTGTRAVVYVKSPDQPGVFEGRVVQLGKRAGGFYAVREGLAEGERVAVKGNIRLDSAMQILARPSMMSAPEAAPLRFDGVPAAFLESTKDLYTAYLGVQSALAGDDLAAAKAAGAPLAAALDAVSTDGLGRETLGAWTRLASLLGSAIQTLDAAGDIDALRAAFAPLSLRLIDLARRFGLPPDLELHRAHCPMAFDWKGADWLQGGGEIANPYFGSEMLTCGSLEEALGTGAEPAPQAAPNPHAHH